MSSWLAFLATAGLLKVQSVEKKREPFPSAERRWFFRDGRLDARPIIWSLRNCPQDWVPNYVGDGTLYELTHKKTDHAIRAYWASDYRMSSSSRCGCSNTQWQPFQTRQLGRAIKGWKRWNAAQGIVHPNSSEAINKQFRNHFIPPS